MKCVVVFIVLAIFIAKSLALECYVCDSNFDTNCNYMLDRNVRTEDCEDAQIGYQRSVCLKTVSFEYGNRNTVRSCARAGPRKDPCFERRNSLELSVCEICDDHLCNGSATLKLTAWGFIAAAAVLLASKKML